jgi:hypothetical protein
MYISRPQSIERSPQVAQVSEKSAPQRTTKADSVIRVVRFQGTSGPTISAKNRLITDALGLDTGGIETFDMRQPFTPSLLLEAIVKSVQYTGNRSKYGTQ